MTHVLQLECAILRKRLDASRRTHDDVRALLLEHLLLLLDVDTTEDDANLCVRSVHAEAFEFVADLVRELARVAEHNRVDFSVDGLNLLQHSKNEHCRLTHA